MIATIKTLMNRVMPCPPKSNFFNFSLILAHPQPLNPHYTLIHTCTTHLSIPIYRLTIIKNWITIDLSLSLFLVSWTTSPLELNVTRFIHPFNRHCTLFHQKRLSIQLTSSKLFKYYDSTRCVTSYFLIWPALSGFDKSIVMPTRWGRFRYWTQE